MTFSFAYSRPWRPDQIPNGQKFSCANCHIDPAGGGPRNKFGQAVEQLVSPGSTQEFWSPALAKLDSDGDDVTNGQELGDPNGTWQAGQPNPGNINLVTNPGDPNSFPTTVTGNNSLMPAAYKLYNNYPNPFNPSTVIAYQIPVAGYVTLKVYDLLGRAVATLVDEFKQAGSYDVQLSADSYQLSSGVYLYTLRAGNFLQTKKFVLLR